MAKEKIQQDPAHALLSASGSHKWLVCTPSARLEEQFPDSRSEYASEGSLAHEICELKLRKQFLEPITPAKFKSRLKKLQENPQYNDEMLRYTDDYIDYISGIVHGFETRPYIAAEKRLDYSSYAPEGFGTGDCIIIGGKALHVIDFKYGKGVPVSAYENSQMMLYALGAYTEYSFLYSIDVINITIVQPRLDSISEYEIPIADLLAWGESIKPIAQKAFAGEGEFVSGEHCSSAFCRARSLCRARRDFNMSTTEYEMKKPPLISNEEVGEILAKAQDLAKWAKDLESCALDECLKGIEIPGWKAVEGRSNRAFTDVDKAFEVLKKNGTEEVMLYERKPLALTKVEDLLGKAKFKELLADYIEKPPGNPALAPEKDKREAIKNMISPEEAFQEPIETGGN